MRLSCWLSELSNSVSSRAILLMPRIWGPVPPQKPTVKSFFAGGTLIAKCPDRGGIWFSRDPCTFFRMRQRMNWFSGPYRESR
jgi:hypothetical protein